jgi:RNA polymerase I-specific transcription initiation factor RRN7
MNAVYAIQTPEVNAAPLLWRVCKSLGGTAVTYMLTKRVANLLELPLTLHHSLAPKLAKLKAQDPESHVYDNAPPEVSLMCAVVIVLKMVYGLDGQAR